MAHDAKNRARGTVAAQATPAPITIAASEIDFTGNTATDPSRVVRFNNATDEFVSGNSVKAVVAALKFKIGVADAGCVHPDERITGRTKRPRNFTEVDRGVSKMKSKHAFRAEIRSLPIMKDPHAMFHT